MTESQLLVGGAGNRCAHSCEIAGLVGANRKTQLTGIDNDEAVATVSGIHAKCADTRYLEIRVQPIGKRGDIMYLDTAFSQ
jgi:hypothetical protein